MTTIEALKEVEDALASIDRTVFNMGELFKACKELGFEKLATRLSIHINDLHRDRTNVKNALVTLNGAIRKN